MEARGINFIDDKFGVEYGKVRETQREKEREIIRKNVLNQLLKDKQREIDLQKEKLYHCLI